MTFDELVKSSGQAPIAVLFYGSACAPCEDLKPRIRAVSKSCRLQLEEFNSANELAAIKALGLRTVPAVVIVRLGEAKPCFTGSLDSETIRMKLGEHGIRSPQDGIEIPTDGY